jgi:hypothetical protein
MPDPVHVFVHVPECAGATVQRQFRGTRCATSSANAPRCARSYARCRDIRWRARLRRRSRGALRQSVLLRDPGGWYVGVCKYRLWCAQRRAQPAPPPIEVWMRARRRNPIARFLLMRCFEVGYPGLYALSSRDRFLRLKTALEGFH